MGSKVNNDDVSDVYEDSLRGIEAPIEPHLMGTASVAPGDHRHQCAGCLLVCRVSKNEHRAIPEKGTELLRIPYSQRAVIGGPSECFPHVPLVSSLSDVAIAGMPSRMSKVGVISLVVHSVETLRATESGVVSEIPFVPPTAIE